MFSALNCPLRRLVSTAAFAVLVVAPGCGPELEEYPVANASGVVLCEGAPLSGGRLQFSPVGSGKTRESGKFAQAVIEPDGTFVLTTYERGDGAVIGEHTVAVWPDDLRGGREGGGRDAANAGSDALGGCPPGRIEGTVTVSAEGPNEFTIELAGTDESTS